MTEPVFAYQHQIRNHGMALIWQMVDFVELFHPERNLVDFVSLRVALTDLPFDSQRAVFEMETVPAAHDQICRWLRWTSGETGNEEFSNLAKALEDGARAADSQMRANASFN